MIDWFATSLNAGEARIIPKVESNDKKTEWKVAEYTRTTAEEMNHHPNGEITFGGTPTDKSIIELCSHLKSQGYKVMISPLLMVDDDSLTKPWRGFIAPTSKKKAEKEIDLFFNGKQGYNKFIMHYASLEYNNVKLKDLIDSFSIGSELKGLTGHKVNEYLYPAIHHLKNLAQMVKKELGSDVKLTYSANWGDEYHNANMDALWCDHNIDWVGINAYFPITDNMPQEQITYDIVKNGWRSGEGIDYYKNGEIKESYTDQAWAWKNVEYWWDSYHMQDSTCWTPQMKPIIFTEYGFASINGATNHPSYYYNPTSGETPPTVNNYAQSLAITASEILFSQMNFQNNDFLPLRFLYVWDARPYPFFLNNCMFWSDCKMHQYSHAVNGKFVEVEVPQHELDMIGNQEQEL